MKKALLQLRQLRVAVDSLTVGSIKIAAGLAGVITSMMLARLLTTADYGRYFLILSIVTVVSTLALLGLDQSALRLLSSAKEPGTRARLWSSHTRLLVPLSLTVAAGAYLLIPVSAQWRGESVSWVLVALMALWIITAVWQRFAAESLRGGQQVILASLFGGLRNNGLFIGLGTLVAFTICWTFDYRSLTQLVFASVLVTLLLAVVSVGIAGIKLRPAGRSTLSKEDYRFVMAAALPLAGVTILVTLRTQVDLWLLAVVGEPTDVGLYAAVKRLAPLVFLPKMIVNGVLAPLINPRHKLGPGPLQDTLRSCATLAAVPGSVVALVLLVAPQALLGGLFGDTYRQAWPILILLSTAQLVNLINGPNTLTLNMLGGAGKVVRYLSITTALFLVGGFFLGRAYGGLGVASAFLLLIVVYNLLQTLDVHRTLGVWTFPTFSVATLKRGLTQIDQSPNSNS